MTEEHTSNEMNKALFTNLIIMLSSSAMQQMGKLVNPLTNKTEVDLQGAQISIDMLAMLQAKTKGNLDKDENKMLNDVVSSLQMNYVETARAVEQRPAASATQAPPEASPRREASAAREVRDRPSSSGNGQTMASHGKPEEEAKQEKEPSAEKKEPKFRKSYGE